MNRQTILYLEDDPDDALLVEDYLKEIPPKGCRFLWAATDEEAWELLAKEPIDLCLVDFRLGPIDGIDVIRRIHASHPLLPCILLTGLTDPRIDLEASEAGAADYLPKSELTRATLERSIRYARKHAEQHQQIESLLSGASCIWWQASLPEGHLLDISTSILSQLGYLRDDLRDHPEAWHGLVHPDSPTSLRTLFASLAQHRRISETLLLRSSGGEQVWFQLNGRVHGYSEGRPSIAEGVLTNITEQHRTEEQQMLLHQAVIQSEEAILITDATLHDGGPRIIFASPAVQKITGYRAGEMIGQTPRLLQGKESDQEKLAELGRRLRRGEAHQTEIINYRKNGERFPCLMRIAPIRSSPGKITHYVATLRDMSEARRKQAELEAALSGARAADEAKSNFLAVMSHELRTPLNPIIAFTELLLEEAKDKESRELLETILNSSEHLLLLIEDILEFSRLQSAHFTLRPEDFALREMLEQTLLPLRANFIEKGIAFGYELEPDPDPRICFDPLRLKQVLTNLLTNALKYTSSGRVTLKVTLQRGEGTAATLQIEVTDTGIGIPAEKLPYIFNTFYQAGEALTEKTEGIGIGLSIVKLIVDRSGGEVKVESRVGEGSCFRVELPVSLAEPRADAEEHLPAAQVPPCEKRILLVEDDPSNIRMMEWCLSRARVPFDLATNGRQAVEKFTRDGESYALILMDLRMPVMDGKEATRRIREYEMRHGTHLPIIALTALTTEVTPQNCTAFGFDQMLPKPIRPSQLNECLKRWLEPVGNP